MRLNGDLLIDDDLTVTGDVNAGTLNASQLALGTAPDARLSANVLTHTGGYPGGTTNFLRADGAFAAASGGAPGPHATTHNFGGSDPLTAIDGSILTTGTVADTRLTINVLKYTGGYPGGTTNFLRADGTFATPTGIVPAAHHTTHEPAGSDQVTAVDASLTTGADLVFKSNQSIRRNTADGSDSGYLDFCGGGGSGQTRGAFIRVGGNESGNVGSVQVFAGNVSGCNIALYRADAKYALFVAGSTGANYQYRTKM